MSIICKAFGFEHKARDWGSDWRGWRKDVLSQQTFEQAIDPIAEASLVFLNLCPVLGPAQLALEAHVSVFFQFLIEIGVSPAHPREDSVDTGKLRRLETVLVGLKLLQALFEGIDVLLEKIC